MFIRKVLIKFAAIALLSIFVCFAVLMSQKNHATPQNVMRGHLQELESSDYRQLINLVDFEFKINHPGCSKLKNDPKIINLVTTAPGNFNKRRVIRETWGVKDDRSLLLFVMGAFNDAELETKIDRESRIFEDIVQGNFMDAYRNMTYKHVAALKWFVYNCPKAKFLLKTDDDVFVNTPLILDLLSKPSNRSQDLHNKNMIFCDIIHNSPLHRDIGSKWYVTKEEFAAEVFPDYCRGYTVLYSADAALQLYKVAQTLPYFFIDDAHMTAMVRIQANLSLSTDTRVVIDPERSSMINGNLQAESRKVMFGFPDLDEGKIRMLWKMVNDPENQRINS